MASNKKLVIFSIVIVILLVLAVGYIGYGIYAQAKVQKELSVFQQGAQYGYEQAFINIVETIIAEPCGSLPLTANNKTVEIINVDCLTAQTQ
ncbi:hypothetical protein KAT80_02450 [Candidatus Pacearchaeota archaeon]|nr:hypothetical protein [Candidatus Pacearchaeota archaeon]